MSLEAVCIYSPVGSSQGLDSLISYQESLVVFPWMNWSILSELLFLCFYYSILMHLLKFMMCIQGCKKVWTYYNQLSCGPLESLPLIRNPWYIMEGCRMFYSPSFPLCLCLNFTHFGDIQILRVLSTKLCYFLLLCLCLCWSLCLKSHLHLSLNGWSSSKTVLILLLWGIFMDYICEFSCSQFLVGFGQQEATAEVWREEGERDWVYQSSFYYANTA